MNKSTIQTLIDKVIGKKGLIRVPSWWMRKVLMQIADWVQERNDANNKKIERVKTEADNKINSLNNSTKAALVELKKSLHTQRCFVVKTGTNAGYVVVDGVTQEIPANTQKVVIFDNTFGFYKTGSSNFSLVFIGLAVTDTSTVTTMNSMFADCSNLTSLDLSGIDTSSVTTMEYMFSNCQSLKSLDLSELDASMVTTMAMMFYYCRSLTSINFSNFKTSSVTTMNSMFLYCHSLTSLDLSSFDTSAVTNMSQMFESCRSLTSLDLSSFNTSSVTGMYSMFNNCYNLTSLDLSNFDTSAVTNMSYMFQGCQRLTSLDLSSFNTSSVINMEGMFSGNMDEDKHINGVISLDLSGFDTSSVTNMSYMFCNCENLTFLDLSNFDTSAVTEMTEIFNNCPALTSLVLGPNFFKTPNVTSIDFSYSTQWTNNTVVTSLVTNSYDRKTAKLSTMTLNLSVNTKAALTDEQKAAIAAKGYTIA